MGVGEGKAFGVEEGMEAGSVCAGFLESEKGG